MSQRRAIVRLGATSTLALVLAACGTFSGGWPVNIVVGSGNVKSETRTVSGFSAVTLSGSGEMTISATGAESLIIKAEDNVLPVLTSDVSGGRLTLGVKNNTSIQTSKGVRYTLTVKDLNDIEVSGAGKVSAIGVGADRFSVSISGTGSFVVKGKADTLAVNISGAGSFNGESLESKTATIVSSGTGNVVVKVSDKLDVTVSGAGIVRYIGDPTVNKTISGVGSVSKQ